MARWHLSSISELLCLPLLPSLLLRIFSRSALLHCLAARQAQFLALSRALRGAAKQSQPAAHSSQAPPSSSDPLPSSASPLSDAYLAHLYHLRITTPLFSLLLDSLLGLLVPPLLLLLSPSLSSSLSLLSSLFHDHILRTGIVLIVSQPAGLKLNNQLAAALSAISWQLLQSVSLLLDHLGPTLLRLTFLAAAVASVLLGFSCALCLCADLLLKLGFAHLWCLAAAMAPLYHAQLTAVVALWRLFQ